MKLKKNLMEGSLNYTKLRKHYLFYEDTNKKCINQILIISNIKVQ